MNSILVVDDMPAVREPIALVLRRAGFEVRCAADGHDAVTQAAERRPDLVLLDLCMPRMDGMSVLRVLRARADTANVPVILLTASCNREHVLAAAKLGVRDYLVKSEFKLSEMLARVRKHLAPQNEPTSKPTLPARAAELELAGASN